MKISENEIFMRSKLNNIINVVVGELKTDKIVYDYVDIPTLEELIAEEINGQEEKKEEKYISQYLDLINKLPKIEIIPKKFIEKFQIRLDPTEIVPCLEYGLIDFIPKNILKSSNAYYLIDNEFVYNFPIPVEFILFRGLTSLVFNLQDIIQKQISDKSKVKVFCGRGRRRIFIPVEWEKYFNKMKFPLSTLSKWNWLFQREILMDDIPIKIRLNKTGKILVHPRTLSERINSAVSWRYYKLHKEINKRIINSKRFIQKSIHSLVI